MTELFLRMEIGTKRFSRGIAKEDLNAQIVAKPLLVKMLYHSRTTWIEIVKIKEEPLMESFHYKILKGIAGAASNVLDVDKSGQLKVVRRFESMWTANALVGSTFGTVYMIVHNVGNDSGEEQTLMNICKLPIAIYHGRVPKPQNSLVLESSQGDLMPLSMLEKCMKEFSVLMRIASTHFLDGQYQDRCSQLMWQNTKAMVIRLTRFQLRVAECLYNSVSSQSEYIDTPEQNFLPDHEDDIEPIDRATFNENENGKEEDDDDDDDGDLKSALDAVKISAGSLVQRNIRIQRGMVHYLLKTLLELTLL